MITEESARPLWWKLLLRSAAAAVASVVILWAGFYGIASMFPVVGAIVLTCMAWAIAVVLPFWSAG